jgi:hypothetical protein
MMRLTLRTLLAYLDDVLEPSQAKLMGQKIQDSPVAGVLVSRIREVMRRRRLSAPHVSGAQIGIDPNIVAQYLDNSLPPDQVANVERVILASDELLAEAGACHQILSLVIGEPLEISCNSRERLHALGPVESANRLRLEGDSINQKLESTEVGVMAAADLAIRVQNRTRDPRPLIMPVEADLSDELPAYLRPKPWAQRVMPVAVVAIILPIIVGLFISDPTFRTGLYQANFELGKSRKTVAPEARTPQSDLDPASPDLIADSESESNANSSLRTVVGNSPAQDLAGLEKTTLPHAPPQKNETVSNSESPPSQSNPSARPQVVESLSQEPVPALPDAPPPFPESPAVSVQYASREGVVLRFDDAEHCWNRMPRQSMLQSDDQLACLEPYEAILSFDQGLLGAIVLGDSLVQLIPPTDGAANGLAIRRGRVVLHRSRNEATQPVATAIGIGEEIWTLELLTQETVCAIEVVPREPVGFERVGEGDWYTGTLYVLAGTVRWTPSSGLPQVASHRIKITDRGLQSESGIEPVPISSEASPDWTDSQKRRLAPLRRNMIPFEKEFQNDQKAEELMRTLIRHSNAKISELAVRGLVLTNSYSSVVQALAECSHEEGRFVAREGLHKWLPINSENGELLKADLENHYSPADAEAVYRLLWGFTVGDEGDKPKASELIGWLRNNRVEIRELADYWTERLTGHRTEFRATNILSHREAQIRRIEKQIDDDALNMGR